MARTEESKTTQVDADGLRTHCRDGHRLVWPPHVRERRTPSLRNSSAGGAVCTAGDKFNQSYQYSGQRKGARTPALVNVGNDFVVGGCCTLTIRQRDGLAYHESIRLSCASLTWRAGIHPHWEWRDYAAIRARHFLDLASDEGKAEIQREIDALPERPRPTSLADVQAMIDTLKAQGWRFDGLDVYCPTCVEEIAARESDLEAARLEEKTEWARAQWAQRS